MGQIEAETTEYYMECKEPKEFFKYVIEEIKELENSLEESEEKVFDLENEKEYWEQNVLETDEYIKILYEIKQLLPNDADRYNNPIYRLVADVLEKISDL